eukprot:NODE_27440_length_513_cov_4.300518.p3 GENE.NODE_27440_length_513_cov_4.300518~~NODE_27440_length_513_cov_4.300518.p3  ORF type:complete len:93 (-),score=14.93 NODE_27440_length_513_cov_4.300518:86-364(-)
MLPGARRPLQAPPGLHAMRYLHIHVYTVPLAPDCAYGHIGTCKHSCVRARADVAVQQQQLRPCRTTAQLCFLWFRPLPAARAYLRHSGRPVP